MTTRRPHAPQPTYGCGSCPARWTGSSRAHCTSCHRSFNSPTAFDGHRRTAHSGQGVCLTTPWLVSAGYRLTRDRGSAIWYGPGTRPDTLDGT